MKFCIFTKIFIIVIFFSCTNARKDTLDIRKISCNDNPSIHLSKSYNKKDISFSKSMISCIGDFKKSIFPWLIIGSLCFLDTTLAQENTTNTTTNIGPNVRYDRLYLDEDQSDRGPSFINTFGGELKDQLKSLIQNTDKSFVGTGITSSFGAGGNDLFFVKYSSDFKIECASTLGGIGDDGGYKVVPFQIHYYVTGYSFSDGPGSGASLIFAKFNRTCGIEKVSLIGGIGSEVGYDMIKTRDDVNFVITGKSTSRGLHSDILTLMVTRNGDIVWSNAVGDNGNEFGLSVIETHHLNDTNYFVTGKIDILGNEEAYLGKHYESGKLIYARAFGGNERDRGNSLTQLNDSNIVLVGNTENFGPGPKSILVIETTLGGTMQYAQAIGRENVDEGNIVISTSNGGMIVGGSSDSGANITSYDAVLFKYNASKAIVQSIIFGGRDREYGLGVTQLLDNTFLLSGNSRTFGQGDYDGMIAGFPEELFSECSTTYRPRVVDIRRDINVSNIFPSEEFISLVSEEANNLTFNYINFKEDEHCKACGNYQNIFINIFILLFSLNVLLSNIF